MKNYIAYYRVSTKKQGNSGLGLESQKSCINTFINQQKGFLIKEYTEIESGKKDKRFELENAIDHCKKNNATLLIAKLDRLSRNVSFIFTLKDSNVNFICCDLPELSTLTLGIFATLAQYERELISERTKKALQAKKEQGFKFGTNNLTDEGRKKGNETKKKRSLEENKKAIALIESLRKEGLSYNKIAIKLNELGFYTNKNSSFYATSVRRLFLAKQKLLS